MRVPTFNLTANVWHSGHPIGGPADTVFSCALRVLRTSFTLTGGDVGAFGVYAAFPSRTDVRSPLALGGADWLEIPAGSGRFYSVAAVDDIAKGLGVEYRIAALIQQIQPIPLP